MAWSGNIDASVERGSKCVRVELAAAAISVRHEDAVALSGGGARMALWLRLSAVGKVTGGMRRRGTTASVVHS
eukprot:6188470-Pleurochrysis_carterae.AAC.2